MKGPFKLAPIDTTQLCTMYPTTIHRDHSLRSHSKLEPDAREFEPHQQTSRVSAMDST